MDNNSKENETCKSRQSDGMNSDETGRAGIGDAAAALKDAWEKKVYEA